MIAVDVGNPIELKAAGIRLLNEGLGADAARAFMKQCFGGRGDLTKEKYDEPDMTPEEFSAMMDVVKNDAVKMGTWE